MQSNNRIHEKFTPFYRFSLCCTIRSLFTNNQYTGVLVMPQRGKDEWSDWVFSNSHTIPLNKGDNILKISFEDWNNNMNVDTNTAMLDYLRLIRL